MAPHAVKVAASEAAPWVERAARIGFAVKGVLYLTIGVLSVRSAVGGGRTVTDSHEAMGVLHSAFAPLLWIVAVGLAGYGIWLLISAFTDAESRGRSALGIARRISAVVRGIVHLGLAYTAVSLALWQRSGPGGDDTTRHWTARVLDAPGGVYLVWIVALWIGGYGLYQFYCAWKVKLDDQLELDRLLGMRRVVFAISRFGIASRGVVFVMLAVLFARAAMTRNAAEAGGPGESMRELVALGRWPFAVIAVGVAAYGIYQFIEARYRRLRVR
jgi:hypothetical protein